MMLSPETAELTIGCARSISAHAFAMNARYVRLAPRSAYDALFFARSSTICVKSTSKKLVTCAETRRDKIMWSAVILRIFENGSTRSPGQGSTAGGTGALDEPGTEDEGRGT